MAFRQLRGSTRDVNTQYLIDIWDYSFKTARLCANSILQDRDSIKIKVTQHTVQAVSEHHRLLLSGFSPHLSRIRGQAVIQFVPLSTQAPEWDPSALIERLSQLQGKEENLDDI